MNIYRIQTTANREEDLVLVTTLKEQQIKEVIEPIVETEREGGDVYNNSTLVKALKSAHPDEYLRHFNSELKTIVI